MALRIGLDKSSGNYITRMDSDDLMDPIKLEELYTNLKKTRKRVHFNLMCKIFF